MIKFSTTFSILFAVNQSKKLFREIHLISCLAGCRLSDHRDYSSQHRHQIDRPGSLMFAAQGTDGIAQTRDQRS